jgi:hypothetical protein
MIFTRFFSRAMVALATAVSLFVNPSRTAAADSDTPQYYELRI